MKTLWFSDGYTRPKQLRGLNEMLNNMLQGDMKMKMLLTYTNLLWSS